MTIKVFVPLVIIGLNVIFVFNSKALAAIDAPHNEANNVSCGSCHGKGLLQSPFWGGGMSFDDLCINCHTASSGQYTDTNAPVARTHSSGTTSGTYGEWMNECRDCHDPHYQKQKNYKNTDAGDLYLASGTFTGYLYDAENNESTLTYSDITYKPGWDAEKVTQKTSAYRRTILFPNVGKLGFSYPIISVDEGDMTITVKGDVSPVYEYIETSSFAVMYGQYIKDNINGRTVKFFDKSGNHSYADGDGIYDGVCEVCHTKTKYFRNNGLGDEHSTGIACNDCHSHIDGLAHGAGGNCVECHGHDDGYEYSPGFFSQGKGSVASHSTHTENDSDDVRGPFIACDVCHDTSDYPYFKSGTDLDGDGKYDLSETDVCDACHSSGGPFDGIGDSVIGAKSNWTNGVYNGDVLIAGKEQWCVGCHDSGTSICNGVSAPDIGGDNETFGYYINGHKSKFCTDCHDTTQLHIDGEERTYSFDTAYYGPGQSGVAYAVGYRLKYVNGQVPLMIPANFNITFSYNSLTMKNTAFRLCFNCHDAEKILDDTAGDGLRTNFKASLPNPPRNYSYAWVSSDDTNEHVAHIMQYTAPAWDSDWDTGTLGPGPGETDSMTACSSCHNVHGAAGNSGSTNESMIRDGSLAGRTGFGFSYVIEDGSYPQVTSDGANRLNSTGAIFRNGTGNMCAIATCHGTPDPPASPSYNATGSSYGTYLEYYRPWQNY